MKRHIGVALLALFMALPGMAQLAPAAANGNAAKTTAPIQVVLVQKKVVKDDKGAEKLVDLTDGVKPGEVIEYQATYKNVGERVIKAIKAELPVPDGLEYVPKSARPAAGVQFTSRQGEAGAEPLTRKSGAGKAEPVPYSQYGEIRWTIDEIAPGKEVVVKARTMLEPLPAPVVTISKTPAVTSKQ